MLVPFRPVSLVSVQGRLQAVGLPQTSLHETRTASSMPAAVCYHLCYHMENTVLPALLEILVSIVGKVPRGSCCLE